MLLSAALINVCAYAESAGFRNEQKLVSNAKAPYDKKYTNIQWQLEAAENVGAPIAYEDSVLLPCGDEVLRLAEENGTRMAAIKLPETVCTDYSGAMLGKILVQPTASGICTIDFTDGTIKGHKSFDGTVDSDVAIIDSMAYFSIKADGGETFYCVDISADMTVLWEYPADADMTSSTVQGDYVIFGAGKKLVTAHYKDGTTNEIPLDSEIIGAPFASQYAVFFTTVDGKAVKIRLNNDGTMEEDTLIACAIGTGASAPLAHNNRLYVASDTGLHILDSINMENITTLSDIKNGCDPIICRGNGNRVYTVSTYSEGGWALHSVYDPGEDSEPIDEAIAGLYSFADGKIAVSENGTMYFRDDIGRLFALTLVEYDIITIIIKLVVLVLIIGGIFFWIRLVGKRRAANNPRY